MKISKIILFLLILPVSLLLDLILYAFIKTCPSCGSFSVWVQTEGALSFPIVVSLTQWIEQIVQSFKGDLKNKL
jgi:hypothetical protein